jgi:hypothetical protein
MNHEIKELELKRERLRKLYHSTKVIDRKAVNDSFAEVFTIAELAYWNNLIKDELSLTTYRINRINREAIA